MKRVRYQSGQTSLWLCLLLGWMSANAQSNLNWQLRQDLSGALPPSVQVYQTITPLPDGSPLRAFYTIINPADPNVEFKAVSGNGTSKTPLQYVQAETEPAYVTINGGFFSGNANLSLVLEGGQVLAPNLRSVSRLFNGAATTYYPTRGAFGISATRTPDVAWVYTPAAATATYFYPNPSPIADGQAPHPPPDATFPAGAAPWNVTSAIGGSPVLVEQGVKRITAAEELIDVNNAGREPRTGIGYTADGRVIMLVVEGRNLPVSGGVTLSELADLFLQLGAVEALNLDGGGSSAMVVNGANTIRPSDAGNQRPVPSVFMLKKRNPVFDTENNQVYAERGGAWAETANAGFFGPSKARIAPTGDGSRKAVYTFKGLAPAQYELSAWWVAASNRATNTPYTLYRNGIAQPATVRVNQTANGGKFNALGTYHIGPADSLVVSNDAQGGFVTVDALQLEKRGESVPTIGFGTGSNAGDYVQGSVLSLPIKLASPNSGIKLNTLRIFRKVGSGAEQPYGQPVDLGGTLAGEYPFSYPINDPLGSVAFRFELADSEGRTLSQTFTLHVKAFEITFHPGPAAGEHPAGKTISFQVLADTKKPDLALQSLSVFRQVDNGPETQLGNPVALSKPAETYNFAYPVTEKVTSRLRFRFRITAANGAVAEKTYVATVVPQRGNFRILVISDLNASFGSTTYEWQVDSVMQRIPRLWKPDLVICGGDMVAGQSAALTVPQLDAMWAGFDRTVAAPLRAANIPFAFTIGNHDGAPGFNTERERTAAYWKTEGKFPGWHPVDITYYPFYQSFTEKENGDIFMVSWDASSANISDAQLNWMREQFSSPQAQRARYRFVIGHLPLYGVAQERDSPGNVLSNPEKLRALLEEFKVHTYISGHHHAYYPGKRGEVELLNAGAIGSGPRRWLSLEKEPVNTATLMDLFYEQDTIVYTTYDIAAREAENMTLFDEKELPEIITGVNGYTIRRDVPISGSATGALSSLNLPLSRPGKGTAQVRAEVTGNLIRFSGTFSGLEGDLFADRTAIGVYQGLHGTDGPLKYALVVTTTTKKNGTFAGTFSYNKGLGELLSTGSFYVLLKTDKYPNGELRSQLYPSRNGAPAGPAVSSHEAGQTYPVRDIPAIFPVRWQGVKDPENNPVTYTYQLARDRNFSSILWHEGVGRATEFKATEARWYALLGSLAPDETATFFHRVVATDGRNVRVGAGSTFNLTRSNEPVEGFVEIPAPGFKYDGVLGTASAVNGHGITVDRAGRVWTVSFSLGLKVFNPDGSAYPLSSPDLEYAGTTNRYVDYLNFKGQRIRVTGGRGLSLAHDGNILLVLNSRVLKLDARTGAPLAQWQGPTSFTNPTSDAAGRVFVATVTGDQQFIIRQNATDPTTFDVLANDFKLPKRQLARSAAISPSGREIYLPFNSGGQLNRYTSTDGLAFTYADSLKLSTGCNSIHVAADHSVWALVNGTGTLAPQLRYVNRRGNLSWSYFMTDVNSQDLRGLAVTPTQDTLYAITSNDGRVYRYVIPREGDENPPVKNIPTYRIEQVKGVNGQGVADSSGVYCRLEGVVHSNNFLKDGLDFSLVDGEHGIRVYRYGSNAGYNVKPGDRIVATGRIRQVNGLTQLATDSVRLVSAGNALRPTEPVAELTESLEALPVSLAGVYLLDPAQWNPRNGYTGFGVDVTDGTRVFRVFISSNSELYKAPAPRGSFTLSGIVSQFKPEAPYLSGYELHPCFLSDLVAAPAGSTAAAAVQVSVFPNPVRDVLTVTLAGVPAGPATLVLYDAYGARLQETVHALQAGGQTVTLPLPPAANRPGFYYLSVQTTLGSRLVRLLKE